MLKRIYGFKNRLKVNSWRLHDYGDIENLQLNESRIPIVEHPDDVLVQVKAASVNPIDALMLSGYGRTLFRIPRLCEMELPLTLGRDFSGIVIEKGLNVGNKYQIGDEVYGFIPIHKQGAFSQAIIANSSHILPKPSNLSHTESASLVYAAMTAWSALYLFGTLCLRNKKGLRVLILGGSGGVGTVAIQLLKSQGCSVFVTCAKDAAPLVSDLGADCVFDYKDEDFEKQVESQGKYHIILDGAKTGIRNIPKTWKFDSYITLNSPLLLNADNHGLFEGFLRSSCDLLGSNLDRLQTGSTVKWGFFVPSAEGFKFINELIVNQKIRPVVQHKFQFEDLPKAFRTLKDGHLRGKIVINYD
ncbi:unnamed protein product [Phyllotreta striolata]|uniref:Enoyl reductase (ER) domain-containing protein n=1 Tax=Phyllotreta striolata TaxID=444603 RepID=A0A9N9TJJ4_PHYSR|nr:unnamed protein product [Phyllotreta striolata]